jgi:hypothetical protein
MSGVNLNNTTAKATTSVWTTYTPTMTLVGGSGNTVPVYSTNYGRYTKVGKTVFVDVYLTGDGGAEGAGSGHLSIAMPIAAGTSCPEFFFPCGILQNSSAAYLMYGTLTAGSTALELCYVSGTSRAYALGTLQAGTDRTIQLKFFYEVN